jgi:pimeloyl-ACP methyl ester carboxylesterase
VSQRTLEINGRKVELLEEGSGPPLLYLHGFVDVHSVKETWLPFHRKLAEKAKVIAPAHPGCAGSDDIEYLEYIDDLVFHYLEVIDALGIDEFDLVGACVGGWIAAELATHDPKKIRRLVLIGASGLYVPGELIGDIFMMAHPVRGTDYSQLRAMLFKDAATPVAREMFPDRRGELGDEVRRYKMLRFSNRFGFKPPYFYHWPLRSRLHRIAAPTLVIWGEDDHMVPIAHGRAYAEGISGSNGIRTVKGTGHSPHAEDPEATASLVQEFLARG